MSVTIYNDYAQEPDDIFEPLPEQLYCEFYNLEMDKFTEDATFWDKRIPAGRILELGCGSGRLSRYLAAENREIIGIDHSPAMLMQAKDRNSALPLSQRPHYLRMKMENLAFASHARFNAILIPYNTLNLLTEPGHLQSCLKSCHTLLEQNGFLALQLHIPKPAFTRKKNKTFQFQIFDLPTDGQLIKESLKIYRPQLKQIEIEERYRLRPMQKNKNNKDYSITYNILGYSLQKIREILYGCGWNLAEQKGGFQEEEYQNQTTWLGLLQPRTS